MGKVSTWMVGSLVVALAALTGCDNGPVGKAINCAEICDKFNTCFKVDESDCKTSCKDNVSNTAAADCSDCLDSASCGQCASDCAEVGLQSLFK